MSCPEAYMAKAIRLAERGIHSSMPNPRVGCVIVKDGKVIGEGWHETAGTGHAEVNALANINGTAEGADVYVTLEPCCHTGRTAPCTQALIDAKVRRVFIATLDPNPKVAGKGIKQLNEAGIETVLNLCQQDAEQLNAGFRNRMLRDRPFVRLKLATSLDGKTTAPNGESQWITSTESRADVQLWRSRSCAILTGVDTVLADNPKLTVRSEPQPRLRKLLRVIVDSNLRTNINAAMLSDQQGDVIIYCINDSDRAKFDHLSQVSVVKAMANNGKVSLPSVMSDLSKREVNELWVECGQALASSLLNEELVDELVHYIAPKLLGIGGRGMVDFESRLSLAESVRFQYTSCRRVGADLRITMRPEN